VLRRLEVQGQRRLARGDEDARVVQGDAAVVVALGVQRGVERYGLVEVDLRGPVDEAAHEPAGVAGGALPVDRDPRGRGGRRHGV
jgi:hypothetical protein